MRLEFIQFLPVKPNKSHIGFISFKIGREYSFYKLGVHLLAEPKEGLKIRLLYPEKQAPNAELQQLIDKEVNTYLKHNYPSVLL